jgi:hypothetical protein
MAIPAGDDRLRKGATNPSIPRRPTVRADAIFACGQGASADRLEDRGPSGLPRATFANSAFHGQSAPDGMMSGETTDLIDLRSYLDAERGAW